MRSCMLEPCPSHRGLHFSQCCCKNCERSKWCISDQSWIFSSIYKAFTLDRKNSMVFAWPTCGKVFADDNIKLWYSVDTSTVGVAQADLVTSLRPTGQSTRRLGNTRRFLLAAGVRQGCVLSLRLFSAVLQWALQDWRLQVEDLGLVLGDGLPNCVDMVGCWPPSAQWNNTWTSGRRLSLGERFHASSQILPNRTASILSCLKFVLRFFLLSCALMGRIAPFIENVCSTTDSALPWLDDWKSRVRSSIEAAHVRLKFWLLCCPPVALNHDSENTHDGNNNLEIFNTKQHYNGAQQAQ